MSEYLELKNKIIKELFKDEEYAEFLCGQDLADISMIDMICAAPISLIRKAEMLKELSKYQTANEEDYFSYKTYYDEIRKALDALTLKENEIFLLIGYEKGIREPKQFCVAPSKDVKMVTEYIKREYFLGNEYDMETCNYWFKLEKWHDAADGEKVEDYFIGDMNNDYTYTLLNGELCYFDNRSGRDKCGLQKQRIKEKLSLFYSGSSLNLPTPWKEGDILEISATPFTLTAIVVVLANSTQYCDCCLPACLYLTKRDLGVGALKHSHIYNMPVYENISPLYFVKRFTGKLKGEETVLKMISNYIKDDKERGEEIFETITHTKHNKGDLDPNRRSIVAKCLSDLRKKDTGDKK